MRKQISPKMVNPRDIAGKAEEEEGEEEDYIPHLFITLLIRPVQMPYLLLPIQITPQVPVSASSVY